MISAAAADGKVCNMYQGNNLHLATTGAEYLSWATIRQIGAIVDLSASKVPVPPADKAPPDSIVERTELPRTPDLD